MNLLAAALPLAAALAPSADDPPRVLESRVREVTVYPAEALVSRAGKVAVARGVTRVEARGLPAGLRDESIRVKTGAGATVVGVDVLQAEARNAPSAAVEELRAARQAKEREVKQAKQRVAVLVSLDKYLDAIRAEAPKVQGQGLLAGGDPSKWDEGFQYLSRTLAKNGQEWLDADARAAALQQELDALDRRLSELQAEPLVATKTVALDLLADANGAADVEISYLVAGASWHPTYDLRATANVSEASLLAYGVVTQATGEDWTGVDLALSTAKPERGAAPPDPQPITLAADVPAPARKSAPARACV